MRHSGIQTPSRRCTPRHMRCYRATLPCATDCCAIAVVRLWQWQCQRRIDRRAREALLLLLRLLPLRRRLRWPCRRCGSATTPCRICTCCIVCTSDWSRRSEWVATCASCSCRHRQSRRSCARCRSQPCALRTRESHARRRGCCCPLTSRRRSDRASSISFAIHGRRR